MQIAMKWMTALALGLSLSTTALAQDDEAANNLAEIEAARAMVQSDRKVLIISAMSLSDTEAEAFWPLYDEYAAARKELGDMRLKVITDFAANFEAMTDDLARELADTSLSYESKSVKLKTKYIKKFRGVVNEVKVVRYFQLESKLDAIINFDLAMQIPLME